MLHVVSRGKTKSTSPNCSPPTKTLGGHKSDQDNARRGRAPRPGGGGHAALFSLFPAKKKKGERESEREDWREERKGERERETPD